MENVDPFWAGFLIAFVIGSMYPIAVLCQRVPLGTRLRLLQNDPGLVLNGWLLTPLSVGILVGRANRDFLGEQLAETPYLLILVVLVVAALLHAFRDIPRSLVLPVQLTDNEKATKKEQQFRREVNQKRRSSQRALEAYEREVPRFEGIADVFKGRGNWAARAEVVFNVFCAGYLAFYFWYFTLTLFKDAGPQREWLLLIAAILSLWFGLRLYSEWYRHFYSLASVDAFSAYWLLLGAALAVLLGVGLVVIGTLPSMIIAGIATVVAAVVGFVARLKPQWFSQAARVLERLPFYTFITLVFLFGIVAVATLPRLDVFEDGSDSSQSQEVQPS